MRRISIVILILTILMASAPQSSHAVSTRKYVGMKSSGGNFFGFKGGGSTRNVFGFQQSTQRVNSYGFKINGKSSKLRGKRYTRSTKPGSRAF